MIQECSWFCERDFCSLGLLYSFKIAFIYSVYGRRHLCHNTGVKVRGRFQYTLCFALWDLKIKLRCWQQAPLHLLRYPISPGHFIFLKISLKTSFCAQLLSKQLFISCNSIFFFRRHKLYWKKWLKAIIHNPSLFCFSFESWEPLKFIF